MGRAENINLNIEIQTTEILPGRLTGGLKAPQTLQFPTPVSDSYVTAHVIEHIWIRTLWSLPLLREHMWTLTRTKWLFFLSAFPRKCKTVKTNHSTAQCLARKEENPIKSLVSNVSLFLSELGVGDMLVTYFEGEGSHLHASSDRTDIPSVPGGRLSTTMQSQGFPQTSGEVIQPGGTESMNTCKRIPESNVTYEVGADAQRTHLAMSEKVSWIRPCTRICPIDRLQKMSV